MEGAVNAGKRRVARRSLEIRELDGEPLPAGDPDGILVERGFSSGRPAPGASQRRCDEARAACFAEAE